jgi:hypothetical protein
VFLTPSFPMRNRASERLTGKRGEVFECVIASAAKQSSFEEKGKPGLLRRKRS